MRKPRQTELELSTTLLDRPKLVTARPIGDARSAVNVLSRTGCRLTNKAQRGRSNGLTPVGHSLLEEFRHERATATA